MRGLHAFGVDDNADTRLHCAKYLFLVWVTFAEHKWVILAERRRWRVQEAFHPTQDDRIQPETVSSWNLSVAIKYPFGTH